MTASLSVLPERPPAADGWAGFGRVLVATDGRTDANPALTAACLLTERGGGEVQVISVLEPLPVVAAELGIVAPPAALEQARRERLVSRVREQLSLLGYEKWKSTVSYGSPAALIAQGATRSGARLLVMGLGRHRLLDRILGGETALAVLRLADVPILAVAPGFTGLPHRAVIALDFSPASVKAARQAMAILSPGAAVYLVHVKPRFEIPPGGWEGWGLEDDSAIPAAFQSAIAEIDIPPDMIVETMTLHGDPASEVLAVARATGADLIVIGSHGHGFFERLLIGSVATKVLRGASCSVLAVPPSSDELCSSCSEDLESCRLAMTLDESEWVERLEDLSARHTGRICSVEEDDLAFGAQVQGRRFRFGGAVYEPRAGRLELMLDQGEASHLTRSIVKPTSVQVLTGADGRARTLRVAHGAGQTLLTFTD